jgi:nucleoid DNA-binding protein
MNASKTTLKKDLVRAMVDQTGQPHELCRVMLDAVFDAVRAQLISDGKVHVRGFGNFVRRNAKRRRWDFRQAQVAEAAPSVVIAFQPAPTMMALVREKVDSK